jgi:hypothetical protein
MWLQNKLRHYAREHHPDEPPLYISYGYDDPRGFQAATSRPRKRSTVTPRCGATSSTRWPNASTPQEPRPTRGLAAA